MLLSYEWVKSANTHAERTAVFVHGILGQGVNWRSFARSFVERCPEWNALLIDLRMHGASQNFEPPHTVAAAADDMRELIKTLNLAEVVLIGHSFGGKVALLAGERIGNVSEVWMLDSRPSGNPDAKGVSDVEDIISKLSDTKHRVFASRNDFRDHIMAAGLSLQIAQWLALNLKPVEGGHQLNLDPIAITSLLSDYAKLDVWSNVEHFTRIVHLVLAGDSQHYRDADKKRARELTAARPDHVKVHVLANAGHWLHSDNPKGLLELIATNLNR